MADERYWMVQDLQFGTCTATSYKKDLSESDTRVMPTVADGYVGHCGVTPRTGAGFLYNWPAVMNNSKAYSGSSDASFQCTGTDPGVEKPNPGYCRGICPEKWHVPTKGEIEDANTRFESTYNCSLDACWGPSSQFESDYNGHAWDYSNLHCTGSCFVYATSTVIDAARANYWRQNAGSSPAWYTNESKWEFTAVRCIMNY
jgi:uncharacterized protein (TIGR02145 family)